MKVFYIRVSIFCSFLIVQLYVHGVQSTCYGIPPEGGACEAICGSCMSDCAQCTTKGTGWTCRDGSCPQQPELSNAKSSFPIPQKKVQATGEEKNGPCYNGGEAVYVPDSKGNNITICDCTVSKEYDNSPDWGPSIFGKYCEKRCDKNCANSCISCISGPEQVWEDGYGCAQYCGLSGTSAYTDTCCYYTCGCDVKYVHRTPTVVSQCLDAGGDEDCQGKTLFDKCYRQTIS